MQTAPASYHSSDLNDDYGFSSEHFLQNFLEESLTSKPKQGAQYLWAQIQSRFCICEAPASLPPSVALPTPAAEAGSQALLCRALNSGPLPPPPPQTRHISWRCFAGWHRAMEFPSPLGNRIPSQLLPFGLSPFSLLLGLFKLGSLSVILHFY